MISILITIGTIYLMFITEDVVAKVEGGWVGVPIGMRIGFSVFRIMPELNQITRYTVELKAENYKVLMRGVCFVLF